MQNGLNIKNLGSSPLSKEFTRRGIEQHTEKNINRPTARLILISGGLFINNIFILNAPYLNEQYQWYIKKPLI